MEKTPMELAVKACQETYEKHEGGPFGAAIVKRDTGEIVCTASNTILRDNDPTAHGEMNVIRKACRILGTYDLTGYDLYTTAYPCAMCAAACIWAHIGKVYYGCTLEDTADIGFRDVAVQEYFEGKNDVLELEECERDRCLEMFADYVKKSDFSY